MTDAFVLGGVRTPVGRYGGSLSHIRTDDLLGQTMAWACERVGVPLERIEDITAGCVNPGPRGDGRHRPLGGARRRLPGLGPGDHRQPLLRLLAVLCAISDRARDPSRASLAVGLAAGVESMSRSGWAFMKGEAPFMPRGPVFCSTRCGPAPAARRTRSCWRATPTSR